MPYHGWTPLKRLLHLMFLSSAGDLNLLVLSYPQIKIAPLYVPQNKISTLLSTPKEEFYPLCIPTNKKFYVYSFLRAPCDLLAYPQGCAYLGLRLADLVQWQYWYHLVSRITLGLAISVRLMCIPYF